MKKLKIGILIDQLVPGGVQKSAIREAKELNKLHYHVTLFVLIRQRYSYQYQDLIKGLKVIFLSDYNPRFFQKPINIPYFSFLTHLHILSPFFVKRYKILKNLDFIISHGTTTCITAAEISKKLHIPYLAYIWDPMIFILEKVYSKTILKYFFPIIRPLTQFYERRFLNAAAIVATSTKIHQQYIYDKYSVEPIIIFPGCEKIKNIPKKNNNFILGYSRWELAKNPMIFLKIAQQIPQAKILIAGSWSNSQELFKFKKQIADFNLYDRVTVISPLPEKKLLELAAQSLMWVHPNFEAFGMSGLEMAAMGLPVIIPKGSGITEIFKYGVHGFFPSINHKNEMINDVKYLYSHPQIAIQMGISAANIAKKYTWDKHARLIINTINRYYKQKKIVCLANAFVAPFSIGGGDRIIIELARRMPKNYYLTVILPASGFYHWEQADINLKNIRFIVLPNNIYDNIESPIPIFITYLIRLIQTIVILTNLAPFQIIHSSTDNIPDVIPGYLFHKIHPEIPWVSRFFHFVEPPFKREGRFWVNTGSFLLQQLSLMLLRQSNIVMIDNLAIKPRLIKKGINDNKIKLHTGGVSVDNIVKIKSSRKLRSDAIFIGRLQPHKGVFDAIAVWKQVVSNLPDAKLVMVGYVQKEILIKLQQQILQEKLTKNIIITGYLNERSQIFKYAHSSKILLFLDHEAGFGLVIAEAMAIGIPVIGYNLPIFGTLYKKGYLTSPLKNSAAIAQNIINLITDQQLYKKLSVQAKQEAGKFTWDLASSRFYSILKTLD